MTYATKYWSQVDVRDATDCWTWMGATDPAGYGVFRGQRSHRLALALSGIALDARLDVNHACRVRACCNPMHLQLMRHDDHARVTRASEVTDGRKRPRVAGRAA